MNESKLDGIMRKVSALLERADHPATPPEEADACRAKADAMMFKYKIESVVAPEAKGGFTPTWKTFTVTNPSSEFSNYYLHIARQIVIHVSGRGSIESRWDEESQNFQWYMDVVAFPSDVRYAEVLMMTCLIEFGKRLEPKYDASLSLGENAYNMRSAGMERKRIAKILFGDWSSENEMKSKNRKVTALIRKHCEASGESADALLGRSNNMASYRLAYAEGFVQTISQRLIRMRSARGEESSALELSSIREKINEAYYEKFPERRPKTEGERKPYRAPNADCARCQQAKSGYCREHGYLRPRKERTRYLHAGGYRSGSTAAQMVDLGREGTPRAGHSEKKELG